MKTTHPSLLHTCCGAPWRVAASSYACLVLAAFLSYAAHECSYEPGWWQFLVNAAYSAVVLLGLMLLVAAPLWAVAALCRRRRGVAVEGFENFVVLLVTLPPLALHVWSALI